MQCPHCSSEVPRSQTICPECYSSTGRSETAGPSADRVRKNLMIFFSDPVHADWFQDRVTKYVPERVQWTWYAETPKGFREITQKSAGSWGLLLIDADVAKQNRELLDYFVKENPGIVIGVQYDFRTDLPASPPLNDAIMFRRPSDIDDWLLIMHTLLDMARDT